MIHDANGNCPRLPRRYTCAVVPLTDRILSNPPRRRKPDWIRAQLPRGEGYQRLRHLMDEHGLHTVCESALCPNMGECWSRGTATIMILGDVCTRSCGFCHIQTGKPPTLDTDEPRRVADSVELMQLRHIVITSVNRDELPDGGAGIWAETIRRIRETSPQTSIEVLIPDFRGDWDALQLVLHERPDILNHNMETVRRLYPIVRPQAKYDQSIELLARAKRHGLTTKTGIMVGIGETDDEIPEVMRDVVDGSGCDILTVGQYLQPTREHLPVTRWAPPESFALYKRQGEAIGFGHVESGPMVRSSYHAEDQVLSLD